jgi:tRNA U34 2-thiouridine synthase MnmA/TrmU
MVKGIGLFSGGLDSILAVRLLQEQNIQIEAVSFVTPFFGPEKAKKAAELLSVILHIIDITEIHLQMLKNPKHGYGRNMNPCIDCHALMFNQAGHLMEKIGGDFLFSGEVLGERPMSQNKNALRTVARESGFEDFIIRPLSARLLPVTKPESEGLVDRERLYDIEGRSRKRQIEFARQFGITYYPTPAGGCLLTDSYFSNRLRDLLNSTGIKNKRDFELLSVGRHFRINDTIKIIAGRNEKDNEKILSLSEEGDVILTIEDIPGPVVIITCGADKDTMNFYEVVKFAAEICVQYSDALGSDPVPVSVFHDNSVEKVYASACSRQLLEDLAV